jgi:hypothetical protein
MAPSPAAAAAAAAAACNTSNGGTHGTCHTHLHRLMIDLCTSLYLLASYISIRSIDLFDYCLNVRESS